MSMDGAFGEKLSLEKKETRDKEHMNRRKEKKRKGTKDRQEQKEKEKKASDTNPIKINSLLQVSSVLDAGKM
jgi:hypothetical protein